MPAQRSLIEIIHHRVASGKIKLPVFNPIALRIQKEVARQDPDVTLIEKLIARDQALTSEVLKVSNSSFYKGLNEVTTIRNAIIRLGINEVSNMVTLVTHENHFRSIDPLIHDIMRKLWRHSLGSAVGSYWLAQKCDFHSIVNEAFVSGLLHDVGKLLILKILDDIRSSATFRVDLSDLLVKEALDNLHTQYGYSLVKQWNLPEKFCLVVRDHHLDEPNTRNYLLAVVRVANSACNKIGIGLREKEFISLMTMPEFNLLNLSDIDLATLEIKLEDSQLLAA